MNRHNIGHPTEGDHEDSEAEAEGDHEESDAEAEGDHEDSEAEAEDDHEDSEAEAEGDHEESDAVIHFQNGFFTQVFFGKCITKSNCWVYLSLSQKSNVLRIYVLENLR